ncbi:hypothetical protein TRVL_00384 [Trypanosoma vivax]|uniref:Uncharacterized protein n=1 Tax=Trypanosoma vivax (strain Y486) TaxID=1055687 RepID=G0U3H5_TRYVY|nr:hypothetical protein TRVL_00384 [Trypanosoma vivax]CCC50832.1 hypothetical protein TVY486_0906530 [Trypanosoma vivax Y486]
MRHHAGHRHLYVQVRAGAFLFLLLFLFSHPRAWTPLFSSISSPGGGAWSRNWRHAPVGLRGVQFEFDAEEVQSASLYERKREGGAEKAARWSLRRDPPCITYKNGGTE